jgi:glycosyltransferase involved in cell wall biosynthesis
MTVLVVTDEYPWPPRTGYRQRVDRVLRTLAAEHDVDLLTVVADQRPREAAPGDLRLRRHWTVVAGGPTTSRLRRRVRWLLGGVPRTLGRREWDWAAARRVLEDAGEAAYDVVWFSHAHTWLALADSVPGPHVVDLDNLDSQLLRHRRRMLWRSRPAGWRGRARALAQVAADTLDIRRWRRIEGDVVERAASVVVCSALDRERLAAPNVCVVPNAYEPTATGGAPDPRADEVVRGAPVLLMVGLLTYEPNRDAAAFFAGDVLPRVRASLPPAEFRVVGRYDLEENVAALRGLPGVSVAGEVPDLTVELRRAAVVVVPIRFGGGTRIKILEAFAHGLPVVTTTVGAEGLEVEDGRHVLVADDPEDLARACLRLLDDPDVRSRLVAEGRALWQARYRSSAVGPAILAAVHEAAVDQAAGA